MAEADAFSFIQETAMKHRAKMRTVAQQITDGPLPLEAEVEGTKERLETQRIVSRAKGLLMDRDKMSEADAFSFIQRTAMQHRTKMRTVAQQIIDGTLPTEGPPT